LIELRRMAGVITSRSELVLVAEINGKVTGFGSIVPDSNELRAVYVHPDFGRKGIGGRILSELESLAREHELPELEMDASLNAEDFMPSTVSLLSRGANTSCVAEHVCPALKCERL